MKAPAQKKLRRVLFALAALALRATSLQPELAEWLLPRARGNPLFIATFCRALRDGNAVLVDPLSGEVGWSGPPPPLPLSLQELLLAEVERLKPETREAMRRAAVIGVTFAAPLLTALCRDVLTPAQLTAALEQATRRAVAVPIPPGRLYTFSSQSLHDAVYNTLSHATRRAWHERVGDLLAAMDDEGRYEQLEQIAYHYGRSTNHRCAARFARLAGDKARARRADEAALSYYAQVLSLPDDGSDEMHLDKSLANEATGDVSMLRGENETARSAYRDALSAAAPPHRARLRAKLLLLDALSGTAEVAQLRRAAQELAPDSALRPWLEAAACWLHAAAGDTDAAGSLCRELVAVLPESAAALLRRALSRLEAGEELPPYVELHALLADSCLRVSSGGGE